MVNLSGADTMKSTNQNSTTQEDNYGSTEKLLVPANKFINSNHFKMFRSATLKGKMASVDRYENSSKRTKKNGKMQDVF